MENYKKPEEFVESKKIQAVIDLMKQRKVTKVEVAAMCGIGGTYSYMERQGREIISDIAKRHPVLALSGQKGYRIATEEDVEDSLHQVREFDSRARKILERSKPHERLIARVMAKRGIANTVQLEQMLPLGGNYKDQSKIQKITIQEERNVTTL